MPNEMYGSLEEHPSLIYLWLSMLFVHKGVASAQGFLINQVSQ